MSRVARYQADRTNQKLYFARLACQHSEAAESVQQSQAGREEAVFHLQGAVLAFFQELNRYYRADVTRPTLESLKAALAQRSQVSPELMVMERLQETGFLKELAQAFSACQYAPKPADPEPESEASHSLIVRAEVSPLYWLPETSQLRVWHKSLQQLIEEFRESMVEF